MLQRHSRRPHLKTGDSRGQALVEFCLVIMVFLTIFTGLIEFGVAFAVEMQVSFASRDAATLASEAGGATATADCATLNRIDQDLFAPATRSKISEVDIFWATATGSVKSGAIERYTPGGTLCLGWGGWTNTLNLYPASSRCASISGSTLGLCLTGHSGPDKIGVSIIYPYAWSTPLPGLIGLSGTGFTFTQTNLVVMEPIPVLQ